LSINYFFFTFIIIGIILSIGLVQTASAEIGKNFDRIQIEPKTFQWTSHYERILDNGQFVNYKLNDVGNIITFESANIIFKLDKTTCSFSLLNPDTRLTSINSFTHDLLIDGLVQPSSCSVTSTTPTTDGMDIKVSRVGVSGSFITTYNIDQKKSFPLELIYDLVNSTKVSKIGVVDTCIGCTGVSLGGDLIKFGDYIMDTENRVHNSLKSTDDTKGNYTLTYEDDAVPAGVKLVIDPTFGFTAGNHRGLQTTVAGGVACPTVDTTTNDSISRARIDTSAGGACYRTTVAWDISSIPESFLIVSNTRIRYDVTAIQTGRNCDFQAITLNQTSAPRAALWEDIGDGPSYVSNDSGCTTATNDKILDLGATADNTIQTNSSSGFFVIGIKLNNEVRDGSNYGSQFGMAELEVTYSSTGPNAVTDLTVIGNTGTTITLDWSEPGLNGGILSGYQINNTTPFGQPMTVLTNNTNSSSSTAVISGLTSVTQYSFRVSAWTNNGNNATGNIVNVTTLTDIAVGSVNVGGTNPNIIPIMFNRQDINNTALFLNVTYSNTFHLACDFHYKFVQTNRTYTNLSNVTVDSGRVRSDFQFNGVNNEIIDVFCWNDNAGGFNSTSVNSTNSGRYLITQSDFILLQQIANFRSGVYGTSGQFGVVDFVTLAVIIFSLVGINRVNESVGGFFVVGIVGVAWFFGIVDLTNFIIAGIALTILLIVGTTKKD